MRKRKRIHIAALFMLTTGIILCSGCGAKEDDNEVNIGYFNNVTHAQALYMKATSALEENLEEGVTVNWMAFNAGPAEVEALFAEDIDIGYIGPVPAVTANVRSEGEVQILTGAAKGGAVLITGENSGITNVEDLSGKNVAVPQIGNTQHLSLLDVLNQYGLKPVTEGGDVTVSAVANADVANTMGRGDVDAALVPEPWGATLIEQGAEILLDYDEIYMDGSYDVAVVVVRGEFLEQHPEIVEAFLEQHEIVTDIINTNQKEALSVINNELENATGKSLSENIISEAFGRIGVSTQLNKESVLGFAQISKEQGFIKEVPASEKLFVK